MYKAIQEIGGYKVGDEVPTEKAITWLKMYKVPPVEEIKDDATGQDSQSEPEEKDKSAPEGDVMLDDYLGRNTNVVKKNIEGDNLSQEQLENLLELEKSDKEREVVIKAIKIKLRR